MYQNKHNPILPLKYYVPDSEAHVMPDGRLYIYGSYDKRQEGYCSNIYRVVSTSDMEHWTIHDVSLKGEEIPWYTDPNAPRYSGIDWTNPTPFLKKMIGDIDMSEIEKIISNEKEGQKAPLLYAPDAICKNGTYYLYFCMADDSEGVATSDKPEGPFENPVQLPCGGIDPAIFIDDDGKAYYYWGQFFSYGVELHEDMVSFDSTKVVDNLITEEEHYFHEGSSMRKIGDTYYYVYADMERGKPTSLGYATSQSPLGPFVYRGIIIDNDGCDPASWNNHGSIEKFGDQWYVFYHRCSRGERHYRRLCIEPITIEADGSIPEVRMTSQGVGKPFGLGDVIKGFQACGVSGNVYIDVDEVYEEKLTGIVKGDEAVFRYVESQKAFSKLKVVAVGSGSMEVWMNDRKAGEIVIENGIQKEQKIEMEPGMYEISLHFTESNDLEIFELILM